ncbi:hypothetical protein KC19_1G052000 [Ceratodon purpureus]|uniref:Kinesin motor domain-containing protein n=1 Tax=Ceratodon purpureus TaxID=3225 RepID=A0A8T0J4Z2_CERPU|nr:hypothetical protein KC19_1G052000 [Ceratodon purpureus]
MCETMERNNGHDSGSSDGSGSLNTSMDKEATQAVQVALNVRPLITQERIQGCKDCILVVPREPQVQIGSHSFTFDHVFGTGGTPLSSIFERCVAPLVEGLFHGYNATVLAYGQTGSGKTYTMGTAYTVGGSSEGVIPKVMETIFKKIETLKASSDFQLRVSFIEILKEEVHDLLDLSPTSAEPPTSNGANGMAFGGGLKTGATVKPPIQIRETGNGGITLAGVTETEVTTLEEMAACLEQGSLCRATGSTNMNSSSSRSHAIFTITVEQRRRWDLPAASMGVLDDSSDDYLCAKLHLVDLAGSERAKRTGADGMRFKEGVHINKGLLALGNVISALGDDKKRKEGGHVPYRDSKLTRLLQDSLGGNSRTVMIACVSPADSNAEETLNTLKYANRARNIQNKPTVNRDPMAAEMQRMKHQLEVMQAELICARGGGPTSADVQMLKQKIAWLEASNLDYRKELEENRARMGKLTQQAIESQVSRDKLQYKLDQLRAGKTFQELDEEDITATEDMLKDYVSKIQDLEAELHQYRSLQSNPRSLKPSLLTPTAGLGDNCTVTDFSADILPSGDVPEVDEAEVQAKEWEHTILQENLDKELKELDKRLEQKEAEMKSFAKPETVVLKQHFERKLVELEEEKKMLQRERDTLMTELESLATTSDEHTHKLQESYGNKLKTLESQIADLKKSQENQSQLLRAKQRSEESAKRLLEEIQRIKSHKVQLQQKQKQESEQFRIWKAQREKEVLQLRKEGRRNVYEMQKLQALHQRQTKVLHRKTEEAAAATKRLKELLEARKSNKENVTNGTGNVSGSGAQSEKALQNWLEQELEVAVRVHEVRSAYEKQMAERAAHAKELAELRQDEDKSSSDPDEHPSSRSSESAASTRSARITLLESMLTSSSSSLVAMASQLSEAEERERNFSGRARWAHLRSMGDAKNLLHLVFNAASLARCQVRDKEEEDKDTREKMAELEELLRQSEIHRQDLEQRLRLKEQQFNAALSAATKSGSGTAKRRDVEKVSVLTKWRQSSDPAKDSSSGSEKSSYALRKGSRDSRRHTSDTEWDSDVHLSDNDLSMEDSDSDWQEKYAGRRNNSGSGSGRNAHKSFLARKLKASSNGLHPKGEEKTPEPVEGLPIPKRNQRLFDGSEHSPMHVSEAVVGQSGLCADHEEPVTPEKPTASSSSSPNDFQGSIPFSFEIAQSEQSPLGEGADRRLSLVGILDEVEAGARRAERAMAVERAAMAAQAAALLDSAFQEGASPMRDRGGHLGSGEESEGERIRRRPLSDLGNIKMLSSQGKPKRKQRTTYNLVTQEPNPPQAEPPSSPLPSSITSLISARASLMNSTTPNSNRNSSVPQAPSDRQKPVPLPLPPTYHELGTSSPSRRPPPHESTGIAANSPLRTVPSFETLTSRSPFRSNSALCFEPAVTPSTPGRTAPTYDSGFTAKSPLRSASMPSYESAMNPSTPGRTALTFDSGSIARSPLRSASMTSYEPAAAPSTPVRTAPTFDSASIARSPLRSASMPSYEPATAPSTPARTAPTFDSVSVARSPLRSASMPSHEPPSTPGRPAPTFDAGSIARSPLRSASMPSHEPPSTPGRTTPTFDSGFPAKSPLRSASMAAYEPLISANSPLRMLPSYQRRIISPGASPMKLTENGTGEVESKHHTQLGSFDSRPNQAPGVNESRHNKDGQSRMSALAGLESIRSKNGAFASMDLMQRSKNNVSSGAGSSQPGSARKAKDSIPASPAAKREKENMRSALRDGRR